MSSRVIKFRAWDGQHKKMHYKVLVGNTSDPVNYTAHAIYIQPGDTSYPVASGGAWSHFDEHSDVELMQYIGHNDQGGIEIYDGDIVVTPMGNKGVIKWCMVQEYAPSPKPFSGKDLFEYTGFVFWNIKQNRAYHLDSSVSQGTVIGNIYENPELMTEEANPERSVATDDEGTATADPKI